MRSRSPQQATKKAKEASEIRKENFIQRSLILSSFIKSDFAFSQFLELVLSQNIGKVPEN